MKTTDEMRELLTHVRQQPPGWPDSVIIANLPALLDALDAERKRADAAEAKLAKACSDRNILTGQLALLEILEKEGVRLLKTTAGHS